MTLQVLGAEYLRQAKVLQKRLHQLREQAKINDDPILQQRIYYLTTEVTECRKTGEYLLHYYEEEETHEEASA